MGTCPAGAEMKGGARRHRLPCRDLGAPASRARPSAHRRRRLLLIWVPGPALPCGKGAKESAVPAIAAPEGDAGSASGAGMGKGSGCRDQAPEPPPAHRSSGFTFAQPRYRVLNIRGRAACPGRSHGSPCVCVCPKQLGHTPAMSTMVCACACVCASTCVCMCLCACMCTCTYAHSSACTNSPVTRSHCNKRPVLLAACVLVRGSW